MEHIMKRFVKSYYKMVTLVLVVGLLSFSVLAADYTSMSTAELAALRGTMRDATSEEVSAFRTEWQSRLQHMTLEERQAYMGRPDNAPADGQGIGRQSRNSGNGSALRSGTGQGYGQKAGLGRGSARRGTDSRRRANR